MLNLLSHKFTKGRYDKQQNQWWTQKLTSRKFWAAVISFVTSLLVAFGVPDLTIEQVIAVISAGSVMIAYIIGEGMVDAARIEKKQDVTEDTHTTE